MQASPVVENMVLFTCSSLFLSQVRRKRISQSTFSQNHRAICGHVTFQIVCYDWISLYFCKERHEN